MRNTNARLPFVKEAGASQILTKLRCAKKQRVSFLPSTEPVPLLGDAGVRYFSRLEIIALERVSDLCLLFEFLT
jgi:hypothetical protein